MNKYFYTCLIGFVIGLIPPVSAQWTSTQLSSGRWKMAVTSVDSKAFIAGGYYYSQPYGFVNQTDVIDIYDAVANNHTTAKLSQARHSVAAISVGNLVFFAGGQQRLSVMESSMYNNIDIYDATTNQWTTAQLSEGRSNIATASAGGKVFFAGGTKFYYYRSLVIDIYDIANNQWTVKYLPDDFQYFTDLIATSVGNKLIITSPNGSSYLYDVTTDQWTNGPVTGSSITTLGNKAFFAGGGDNSARVDIYDATTNQWSIAQLSQGRSSIAAISVGDKAFFAGGSNNSTAVDIYDTTTNQWSTAQLSVGRSGISTTKAGNKVFFAGSSDNSSDVDIYDAVTNQWSVTQMPQVKNQLSAVNAGEWVLFVENGTGTSNQINTGKLDIYSLDASTLPVNFLSFSGKWIENLGAQLTWQTSWESNNKHFDIQRSNDAKSFESIGRIEGKGTTKETNIYSYIDPQMPDSISYYRLKQVDLDGTFHYSSIISISRQLKETPNKLTIWPSPTSTHLNISVSSNKPIQQITVYDLAGRQLSTQTGTQQTIDVSKFSSGTYIIDVTISDQLHLRSQFIKQQ